MVRKPVKHIYLRLREGRIYITAPPAASRALLEGLLEEKAPGLMEKAALYPSVPEDPFSDGKPLLYLGKEYLQKYVPSESLWTAEPEQGVITVKCPAEWTGEERKRFFQGWYFERLTELLPPMLDKWQARTGITAGGYKVELWKSSWGKCYLKTGVLGFNAALAQAPCEVIEAVVLHELLHLRFHDHQEGFHRALDTYMPGAKDCDAYLKKMPNVL